MNSPLLFQQCGGLWWHLEIIDLFGPRGRLSTSDGGLVGSKLHFVSTQANSDDVVAPNSSSVNASWLSLSVPRLSSPAMRESRFPSQPRLGRASITISANSGSSLLMVRP